MVVKNDLRQLPREEDLNERTVCTNTEGDGAY